MYDKARLLDPNNATYINNKGIFMVQNKDWPFLNYNNMNML